jgi:preprotein translocase subunit YajC
LTEIDRSEWFVATRTKAKQRKQHQLKSNNMKFGSTIFTLLGVLYILFPTINLHIFPHINRVAKGIESKEEYIKNVRKGGIITVIIGSVLLILSYLLNI